MDGRKVQKQDLEDTEPDPDLYETPPPEEYLMRHPGLDGGKAGAVGVGEGPHPQPE
jgi:hypothetical protein